MLMGLCINLPGTEYSRFIFGDSHPLHKCKVDPTSVTGLTSSRSPYPDQLNAVV